MSTCPKQKQPRASGAVHQTTVSLERPIFSHHIWLLFVRLYLLGIQDNTLRVFQNQQHLLDFIAVQIDLLALPTLSLLVVRTLEIDRPHRKWRSVLPLQFVFKDRSGDRPTAKFLNRCIFHSENNYLIKSPLPLALTS